MERSSLKVLQINKYCSTVIYARQKGLKNLKDFCTAAFQCVHGTIYEGIISPTKGTCSVLWLLGLSLKIIFESSLVGGGILAFLSMVFLAPCFVSIFVVQKGKHCILRSGVTHMVLLLSTICGEG